MVLSFTSCSMSQHTTTSFCTLHSGKQKKPTKPKSPIKFSLKNFRINTISYSALCSKLCIKNGMPVNLATKRGFTSMFVSGTPPKRCVLAAHKWISLTPGRYTQTSLSSTPLRIIWSQKMIRMRHNPSDWCNKWKDNSTASLYSKWIWLEKIITLVVVADSYSLN